MNTRQKIEKYIKEWESKGYESGIPDEVPDILMSLNLAPSYKAISLAILRNDMQMESLGFSPVKSPWYSHFKKIELEQRHNAKVKK